MPASRIVTFGTKRVPRQACPNRHLPRRVLMVLMNREYMNSPLMPIVLVLLLLQPLSASGSDATQETAFSYNILGLLLADAQHPARSTQNPDNAFLDLYRCSGALELRPDIFWDPPFASAVFKPRFTAAHKWWEDGMAEGKTDSESRAFVNEWRIQGKPLSYLFVSFGKEKMLWGPSFLADPSNILFSNTEKINPKREIEGKYLAKLIFIRDNAVTVTAGSETQKERTVPGETLNPLRFVKTDLMGGNYAVSLVGYHRRNDRFRLGSYGQWTASDAMVLYYDGLVTRGTEVLYPREDAGPLSGAFISKYEDSRRIFTTATTGGSYTFLSGSTLSLEFLYNGQGYGDAEAAGYYRLRRSANDHFFDEGPVSGLAKKTLAEAFNNGLPFLRKYYLMGQFQLREIKNVLDLVLRYLYNLEEHAGQASTILEWRITDNIQFFNINSAAVSHADETEFKSAVDRSCMIGIEMHL